MINEAFKLISESNENIKANLIDKILISKMLNFSKSQIPNLEWKYQNLVLWPNTILDAYLLNFLAQF